MLYTPFLMYTDDFAIPNRQDNLQLQLLGVCDTGVAGAWFNIKMSSCQYRKSRCGDETIVRLSHLHNGISYTGKIASLYWISPLCQYLYFLLYHSPCYSFYFKRNVTVQETYNIKYNHSINLARNGNSGCANEILGCAKCHFWWKSTCKWKH